MKNKFATLGICMVLSAVVVTGCGQQTIPSATAPATTSQTTTTTTQNATLETKTNPPSVTATATTLETVQSSTQTITATTPIIPLAYLPLYNQLQGYVTTANNLINSSWDGSTYPVNYAAELLTADTNAGPGILTTSERQTMLAELDGEVILVVKTVTVEIGFPVFDPNFYIFTGQTANEAQQTVQNWLDYYQTLAQAIHSRGLKMIVESNPLLGLYIDSTSSFNPSAYYKSLDFSTYQQLRSQHNIILAQQIKPDYLLLQTEPQTDAVNDFRPELNNAVKDTAMISRFVTDLENAGITGLHTSIQIGSGAGTWQPDWKSYFTGLAAINGLDKLDTHIYNLQPGINQISEVPIAMQVADIAHAAGKGVTMSEFWFHKSTSLVGLTEGVDSLADIRVRDMFSFWSPLDAQFFHMISELAIAKHFDYISAFGHYHWFALIDYNSLKTVPVYPPVSSSQNETVDNQITLMQNQSAKQALNINQLSITGKAYQYVIAYPLSPP